MTLGGRINVTKRKFKFKHDLNEGITGIQGMQKAVKQFKLLN